MVEDSAHLPDLRRLRLLVELSRLGTMAAVAQQTGYGTSAVSKHLAVLEQEVGVPLLTPLGRRVALTPAGKRLVEHAVGILAAVEEARAELGGESEPTGRVRLASFYTAVDAVVVPALVRLRKERPGVEVQLHEYEPEQTLALLLSGGIDLGLVYDYSLVPRAVPAGLSARRFGDEPLFLSMPAGGEPSAAGAEAVGRPATLTDLRRFADTGWLTNSRGSDDDELVQRVCALAGFTPRIAHRVDSLHLINSLVGAGLGVALLAESGIERHRTEVEFRPLDPVCGTRRTFLVARRGQWAWPPIATVARLLTKATKATGGGPLDEAGTG